MASTTTLIVVGHGSFFFGRTDTQPLPPPHIEMGVWKGIITSTEVCLPFPSSLPLSLSLCLCSLFFHFLILHSAFSPLSLLSSVVFRLGWVGRRHCLLVAANEVIV